MSDKKTFKQLELIEPLLRSLTELGYENPTPIQEQAIPILLQKKDILGCAQTGTGKTAAFALPLLQNLASEKRHVGPKQTRVLILTPTRELAIQIYDNFNQYGKYLQLKSAVVFGGVGLGPQVKALSQGVDVLIATPGRLQDLISQRFLSLAQVTTFVLDEADRMLDMGFIHDIKKILPLLPAQRHNLFFSATMPKDIVQLSQKILKNPVHIEVTPESTTAEKINQSVMFVDRAKKRDLLRHILNDPKLYRVIVFTRTKHGANRVAEVLMKNKISAEAIHGDKSQNARQRALENFRSGKTRVLIATDIVARGIDVDGITHVINYEIPHLAESYVHRIGRTARAGAEGIAISFCDMEEKAFIQDIEKKIGVKIQVDTDHPYHAQSIQDARSLSVGKAKAQIESQQNQKGGGSKSRHRRPRRDFTPKALGGEGPKKAGQHNHRKFNSHSPKKSKPS